MLGFDHNRLLQETTQPAEALVNQNTLIIIVVVLGVIVFLALLFGAFFYVKRKDRKEAIERKNQVEGAIYAAEEKRLQTLLDYMVIKKAGKKTTAPENTLVQPQTIWAFEATPQAPVCVHGLNYVASKPGYRSAFIDVCPQCCPQECLASGTYVNLPDPTFDNALYDNMNTINNNTMLQPALMHSPMQLQSYNQVYESPIMSPNISIGQDNNNYGISKNQMMMNSVDATNDLSNHRVQVNSGRKGPKVRIYKARNRDEYPDHPPPAVPPGYVAVPMVLTRK